MTPMRFDEDRSSTQQLPPGAVTETLETRPESPAQETQPANPPATATWHWDDRLFPSSGALSTFLQRAHHRFITAPRRKRRSRKALALALSLSQPLFYSFDANDPSPADGFQTLRLRQLDGNRLSAADYFELESSGVREEIRYHYRFKGKPRSESFPYRLADGQWHKIALTISASHLLLHVDCNSSQPSRFLLRAGKASRVLVPVQLPDGRTANKE
ncbi:unnamed protein product [Pleuronectes platessa]|uniref:Thrombospondin-like N-terminal domain-containing protein n=1 Tax=Pleuronectes platessa TaxID=8262 RepID=A0A9N7UXQ5_PLEPL|nr:unnamed protein product [Pleuronectes platessa]